MSSSRSDARGKRLALLSVGALGVVYGDIGTSPLYAFREAFVAAEGLGVTRDAVFGILSLVFWSLVLVVSVKYLAFVLRADNQGEGGILALTALVTPEGGGDSHRSRRLLILVGLFGTALLYGDGAITPAISVLAAVEGLDVATPGFEAFVVPVAVAILVVLFVVQRRGTAAIGSVFGPIMIVWFTVLAVLGIGEILQHPAILQAVDPSHAVRFILHSPRLAFLALGGVFLVVTGSEALYADMGHFGRTPIRLGWFALVFPALLLNYFGQGALLISSPGDIDNPFFRLAPSWGVLPLVLLATAATVIASQALISGAFSLTAQGVQLGYLPRVKVDHTSEHEAGQVYVRSINYALLAASVTLVIAFGSSSNLAAAYGVAVTTTMVITTVLLLLVMRERWRWSRMVVVPIIIGFLVVDLGFFGANILKIPAGGWVPLVLGLLVFAVMTTWRTGQRLVRNAIRTELPIERFIGSITEHPQQRVAGTAIYMYSIAGATPPALLNNLRHNEILHDTIVIVTVQTARVPHIPRARRVTVHDHGSGFFEVYLRFGFTDDPDVPETLGSIVMTDFGIDPAEVVYFLGQETIIPTERPGMALWREHLFALMHRNRADVVTHFHLPVERVVELGMQVEV